MLRISPSSSWPRWPPGAASIATTRRAGLAGELHCLGAHAAGPLAGRSCPAAAPSKQGGDPAQATTARRIVPLPFPTNQKQRFVSTHSICRSTAMWARLWAASSMPQASPRPCLREPRKQLQRRRPRRRQKRRRRRAGSSRRRGRRRRRRSRRSRATSSGARRKVWRAVGSWEGWESCVACFAARVAVQIF